MTGGWVGPVTGNTCFETNFRESQMWSISSRRCSPTRHFVGAVGTLHNQRGSGKSLVREPKRLGLPY